MEVDDAPDLTVEETVAKKRKKKLTEESFLPLPDDVIADCTPEVAEELKISYQLFQAIMRIPKIEPFLDKPNENLFGMSTYYKIIKKPMWLTEVQRKLLGREYDGIGSFVADVRLILENCYRYWGATHKFSRKALYMEHKLEQRLSNLPQSLQDKCLDPELNAKEVIVKIENTDDYYNDVEPEPVKESLPITTIKGFESKILNKVLESEEPEEMADDSEEQAKKEALMLDWEKENLVDDYQKSKINITWPLVEIGTFLKLTWEAFNVEEITQYEIERMLLMPKESITLANLMTSMLSPQIHRTQLDVKPVMPYEIWTSRLKKRLDSWYNLFHSTCDVIETFSSCGVEPLFWYSVGPVNPMIDHNFHELSFYKRVWIVKSLCNNLMHIDKTIQGIILDPSVTNDIKPIKICTDKKGISYFRIPFFREIRIYKQARLPDTVFQDSSDVESTISNILDSTTLGSTNDNDNDLEILPNEGECSLIADSIDSLIEYIDNCKKQNKLFLARNLSKQLRILKKERRTSDGLMALYNQWHDYQNRSQEYFTNMLNLWLAFEKPPRALATVNEEVTEEVLGKRKTKQNFDFSSLRSTDSEERSEDNESSDVSDWENDYMKKNKKKVELKRKSKQSISDTRSESSDVSKHDDNAIAIHEVSIKQEVLEDVKPDLTSNGNVPYQPAELDNTVNIKSEIVPFQLEPMVNTTSYNAVNLENLSVSNSLPPVPPGYMIVPISSNNVPTNIKKEKDDVICISSDEENESVKKPLNPVNNGIPQKVTSAVPLPVVTPSPQQPPTMIRNRRRPSKPKTPLPPPIPVDSVPGPIIVGPVPPMPQPIPAAPVPLPIPTPQHISPKRAVTNSMGKAPVPRPIPIPAPPARQMPLPIPEPAMPQPILEPPMPVPFGVQAPQTWSSPKAPVTSPKSRGGYSPRLRSPLNTMARTPSPRAAPSPRTPAISPRAASSPKTVVSPVRPNKAPVRNLFPSVPTVEGVLEIGQKPDGSYGYHVRLPDGGIINMTRIEIDDIRKKNNGILPVKIEVPLSKNKKF
ncbi:unnamed protein product [Nezara viridula]|uniref:Bromo domain-containing protein n=1 Tax=Nezara viridula TaxID=85310 RepID=A0A9P0EDE7_NEZVI|nr:unnamed protein product [Nezara viridula]